MKNLLIAAKVFAFVTLLFVPSIAVLVSVGLLVGQTWWVSFVGVPVLFGNLIFLLLKPIRDLIWQKLDAIAH